MMPRRTRISLLLCAVLGPAAMSRPGEGAPGRAAEAPATKLQGVLISADQASVERVRRFKQDGMNTVVLNLTETDRPEVTRAAVRRIEAAGLAPYYWIEIGRNRALADAHPEWMASLQGHPEWRRHYPAAPQPEAGEVVKNYPWVPVLYQEAFEAHRKRVAALLRDRPRPRGIFLNDLQGAPSACGCGNLFCRWVADYGPIRTATPLPSDAAARFVAAVGKLAPGAEIIPVWVTECEEHESDSGCGGVPCFPGSCWYEYTRQLMPIARQCRRLAALLTYRALGRDEPRYSLPAGWIRQALRSFESMPPQRGGQAVPVRRVIAVLQGWEVTPAQRRAQIERVREAGTAGFVMALLRIEQGWEPRIVPIASARPPTPAPHASQ